MTPEKLPTSDEFRRLRRKQLLLARARRNVLIEQHLAHPRARRAVPKWIARDLDSSARRTAARLYRLAEQLAREEAAKTN